MKIIVNIVQALFIAAAVVGAHVLIFWSLLTADPAPPIKPIIPPRPIQVSLITPAPPAPAVEPKSAPAALPPPPVKQAAPPPQAALKSPPRKVVKPKPKAKKPKPRKVRKPKPAPKPKVVKKTTPAPKPAPTRVASAAKTSTPVSRPAPAPVKKAAAAPAPKPKPAPVRETKPVFNAGYLRNPPPKYPRISKRRGEEGVVSLRVKVSPQGRALEVRLNRSSGHNRLDKAAQKTVKKWRFVPAKRGDKPITAWVIVPVHFKLQK